MISDDLLPSPHFPNWESRDGVLNIIALGHLVIFSDSLDLRSYDDEEPLPLAERELREMARALYIGHLRDVYRNIHGAKDEKTGEILDLFRDVFCQSALSFAQSVYTYCEMVNESTYDPTNLRQITKEPLAKYLQNDLSRLDRALSKDFALWRSSRPANEDADSMHEHLEKDWSSLVIYRKK